MSVTTLDTSHRNRARVRRASLLALTALASMVGAARSAFAIDKQGSAHGGDVDGNASGIDITGNPLLEDRGQIISP